MLFFEYFSKFEIDFEQIYGITLGSYGVDSWRISSQKADVSDPLSKTDSGHSPRIQIYSKLL
jgi:hypothetical protein